MIFPCQGQPCDDDCRTYHDKMWLARFKPPYCALLNQSCTLIPAGHQENWVTH